MKITAFTNQLFNELAEELSVYSDLGTVPVRRVTGAIHSIDIALGKLKTFIAATGFLSQDEEIRFFKYEKPRFTAEHYFAMEIFSIETTRPVSDSALLKTFYEQEIRYVRRFFEMNKFLYAYYQFDMKELDHLLFVRGAKPSDIPVPETISADPAFSTCCDNLWGRFMAFERLEEWLRNEISGLDRGQAPAGLSEPSATSPGGMKWTGESINLVELAYGIWLTGQLNNGNVSVTETVEFLEHIFRVRIGKPHRRWQSIVGRKRLSYTKYLDEMKAAIEKRVEEEWGR